MGKKLGSLDVKQMVAFVRAFQGGKQVVDEQADASASSTPAGPPVGTASRSAIDQQQSVQPPPSSREIRGFREGATLFRRLCTRCHEADGRGSVVRESLPAIPDFTRGAWQQIRADAQLLVSILEGKGNGMPPFRGKIGPGEARDVMVYIRSFAPSQPRPSEISDNFDSRFRELKDEVENLARQVRALSSRPPQR
jgi:mono/diheme cytochrome c family protein